VIRVGAEIGAQTAAHDGGEDAADIDVDRGAEPALTGIVRADGATCSAVIRVVAEVDAKTVALDQGCDAADIDVDREASPARTDTARAGDATASAVIQVAPEVDASGAAVGQARCYADLPRGGGRRAARKPGGHGAYGKEAEYLAARSASGNGTRDGVKLGVVHGTLPLRRPQAVRCDLLAPQGTPSLPLRCPHCMVSRPRPRYRRRGMVSSDAARPVGAATEELLVPLEDRHGHYLVGYEE
jgi:hypothetical protein